MKMTYESPHYKYNKTRARVGMTANGDTRSSWKPTGWSAGDRRRAATHFLSPSLRFFFFFCRRPLFAAWNKIDCGGTGTHARDLKSTRPSHDKATHPASCDIQH